MRDGCRLAVDAYVPQPKSGTSAPHAFRLSSSSPPIIAASSCGRAAAGEVNPNTGKFRDFFVPRGYAVVVVDVRGTGASFGTRDSFRSPREREDSREIADWIVAQPWSNGAIGATGISYLGAASDFLASHRASRGEGDRADLARSGTPMPTIIFPGGIQLKSLTKVYDELMVGLDHDRRDVLQKFSYFNNPDFEGPQPVDDDPARRAGQRRPCSQHLGNFRQTDFMAEFKFREEGLALRSRLLSSASISPYSVADGIRPDVAILSVSGWLDGAGYMNGAIARYLTKKR